MGLDGKIKHKAEETDGRAEQWAGEHTDNPELAERGREEQAEARLKQAGEHVKDAARHAGEHVRDAARDARDALPD